MSKITGYTFQFLYSSQDARHRVSTPFWVDSEKFEDAAKEAKAQADALNAKVGFYLKGYHARLP